MRGPLTFSVFSWQTPVMIRTLVSFVAGAVLVAAVFLVQRFAVTAPASPFVSVAGSAAAAANRESMQPHLSELLTGDIETQRAVLDEYFYGPKIDEARRLYPVLETASEAGGVYVEVFEPLDGVAEANSGRVLINLHGGAFSLGARTEGRLESIPLAHRSGMRILSVDYRQGPEHRFPAASEDVAIVYRHLLETHAPGQIGIFGCSAGGLLAAQSVA